jgi:selenophosphate synthase
MDHRKRIRLTQFSTKAGWASKFAPGGLEQALEELAPGALGAFAGGTETRDDAWYVPVVDAPYRCGQIAAAVVGEVVEDTGVRVTA